VCVRDIQIEGMSDLVFFVGIPNVIVCLAIWDHANISCFHWEN